MVQNSAVASQPGPEDTQVHEKRFILRPGPDKKYRCEHCENNYPCPEPYMFHVAAKHGGTDAPPAIPDLDDKPSVARASTVNNIKHIAATRPDVTICYGVWCADGTHYVQVNVSQCLGSDFVIQVDEDKTFTVEKFLQMEFSRTEGH